MGKFSEKELKEAIAKEGELFTQMYSWLETHMPSHFFDEITQDQLMLVAHNLMGFHLQDFYSQIFLKNSAIVLIQDSPDADLNIIKHYNMYGIKNYQTFISDEPPPIPGADNKLRIAVIHFSGIEQPEERACDVLGKEQKAEIFEKVKSRNPDLTEEALETILCQINASFARSIATDRLVLALDMFFRAKTRDNCQYEVRYNENWKDGNEIPSLQIVFAWRNTPKHRFLYRLIKMIHRHGLTLKRVNTTYVDPYTKKSILVMSLGLHGANEEAAWDVADIDDFLKELAMLKYFDCNDKVETVFIDGGFARGNIGHLIRSIESFVHQTLVHADINLYSLTNIEEGLCRHPELTMLICEAFEYKFHPQHFDEIKCEETREKFLKLVKELDTGNEINDIRRKNILRCGMDFVTYTLKTNFYRNNKDALCFRLDPAYLDHVPFDCKSRFPELPYAVFFMKGMHYIGFHIRFKDLSRGGLRTVFPKKLEQMVIERNYVFSECYNLAYTQQKKNKDIPEGGSKAVIFLEPSGQLQIEADIYKKELTLAGQTKEEIHEKIYAFTQNAKLQYLYQSQRSFVHVLLSLINCDEDGTLRAKHIVDYYKKPEYIYLGPDENMHNIMIDWIAEFSCRCNYKVGAAFISSKPKTGINHKEYGVTSLGVTVYVEEALQYLGIDPKKDPFTIKITGGPDGDVAGNMILNLHRFFPKTAKLVALVDVSGTIYDPEGLDLDELVKLFHEGKPINCYPPKKLNDRGFLLDTQQKREQSAYATQTLCYKKDGKKLIEEWIGGSEMNHLLRFNVHQAQTDIFVPGGGRPRTLNETNYDEFLDESGLPTSKAIVEGANLYLTPAARRALEELGVLIIKDSSANKGGVICSSFEVLAGLVLTEEEFLANKDAYMKEVLAIIRETSRDEAKLLLETHAKTGAYLTDISDLISQQINTYTYELLDYLQNAYLKSDDPLIDSLFNYCPKLLTKTHQKQILENIPDVHKKAIISCFIASKMVYS
ncbi:MAG: NAD-glutamate dehydrogenase, partial [Chlamydiia bacterium]|nr:NAD-glutamate dehydrogenase [Chlamydiia bacterium]